MGEWKWIRKSVSLSERKVRFDLQISCFREFLGWEVLWEVERSLRKLTRAQKSLFWLYICDFRPLFNLELWYTVVCTQNNGGYGVITQSKSFHLIQEISSIVHHLFSLLFFFSFFSFLLNTSCFNFICYLINKISTCF